MASWTILTCEYPPLCGGVGDYTAQVAAALAAAGDEVTVFTPSRSSAPVSHPGVTVVVLPDTYGAASRRVVDRWLHDRNTTVLVEYVPTAFGLKGANLPWCRWLRDRSRQPGAVTRVMFHEPYFQYGWQPLHQTPLSILQRQMARILLSVGDTTYLSTESWRSQLSGYAPDGDKRPFVTLPIPSTIPGTGRAAAAEKRRSLLASPSDLLVGHFGTYGTHVAPMLEPALAALLARRPDSSAVCTGDGSDRFVESMIANAPALRGRVVGTGRLPPGDVAEVIAACDLMLQPYPDGVTTRRTSVMAALINGRPVVTTTGHLTESVWQETGAVVTTRANDRAAYVDAVLALLADPQRRDGLASRGAQTYADRFALERTIKTLRTPAARMPASSNQP